MQAENGGRIMLKTGAVVNGGSLRDQGYLPSNTNTTYPILDGGDIAFNTYWNGDYDLPNYDGVAFDANLRFNYEDGLSSRELALCEYFSAGPKGVIISAGPMGSDYVLNNVNCKQRAWIRAYYLVPEAIPQEEE